MFRIRDERATRIRGDLQPGLGLVWLAVAYQQWCETGRMLGLACLASVVPIPSVCTMMFLDREPFAIHYYIGNSGLHRLWSVGYHCSDCPPRVHQTRKTTDSDYSCFSRFL